jgi:hypothetical protein
MRRESSIHVMLACPILPLATAYAVWLSDSLSSASFRTELLFVLVPSLVLMYALLSVNFRLLSQVPDLGMYYAGLLALLFVPSMYGIGNNNVLEFCLGMATGFIPAVLFLYFTIVRALKGTAEQPDAEVQSEGAPSD